MRVFGDPAGKDVQSIVLTVCGLMEGGAPEPGGSCFLIAPQLAITAKHVVEDVYETYELDPIQLGPNDVGFSIQVAGQGPALGTLFEVEVVSFCPRSDLAILSLLALNEETFRFQHAYDRVAEGPFLNYRPPALGSEIWTFGYTNQNANEEPHGLSLTAEPRASRGEVRDYFHERRDPFLIDFPSFQTSAEFVGHMSGSPVANSAGEIIGVVSASLQSDEPNLEPVSYAAALWPLLGTRVVVSREGRRDDEPTYLYDLYRDRNLFGIGWNHPQFDPRSDQFLSSVPRAL